MKRWLVWIPFVVFALAVSLLWFAFLVFEPVATVDSRIEASMSLAATNGWSRWTAPADVTENLYVRKAVIDRPFHRIELVQTARGLSSDEDLDIPKGGGSIKAIPTALATVCGVGVMLLARRLYASVIAKMAG